ncbi:MAG TPA: hypothetical protein VE197_01135, partial [Mycobacterium sp.]|nr:hypothetical protein [Mycobacterium sp.]
MFRDTHTVDMSAFDSAATANLILGRVVTEAPPERRIQRAAHAAFASLARTLPGFRRHQVRRFAPVRYAKVTSVARPAPSRCSRRHRRHRADIRDRVHPPNT